MYDFLWQTTLSVGAAISIIYYGVSYLGGFSSTFNTYKEVALIQNLQFCEKPFSTTPYLAQGASALAHLPYVPSILLGIYYTSPTVIPSLENNKVRALLWIQLWIQTFTSFGHSIPNPRMILSQEISLMLSLTFLFKFLEFTTPMKYRYLINWRIFIGIIIVVIGSYLTIGLFPIIFTLFITSIGLGKTIKGAFGLITLHGSNVLLSTFIPTAFVLVFEIMSCDWLQRHITSTIPWHLVFDILFWQVVGSAIDIVIITPTPSVYLMVDK